MFNTSFLKILCESGWTLPRFAVFPRGAHACFGSLLSISTPKPDSKRQAWNGKHASASRVYFLECWFAQITWTVNITQTLRLMVDSLGRWHEHRPCLSWERYIWGVLGWKSTYTLNWPFPDGLGMGPAAPGRLQERAPTPHPSWEWPHAQRLHPLKTRVWGGQVYQTGISG